MKNRTEVPPADLMTVGHILRQTEELIAKGGSYPVWSVARDLMIFEYHISDLTQTHLRAIRRFLKEAEKLGYTGFAQFQIGNSWLPSGMWAYKERSENRNCAPKGEFLYRSFQPKDNHWEVLWADGCLYPEREGYNNIKTIKELERYIASLRKEKK